MSIIISFFSSEFLIRALIAGLITAVVAPLLGMFLVTRRYAYLADTLAHVSLAGVAIGFLFHTSPLFTALIASVLAAVCTEELRRRRVLGEAALTLFLSGGLATAAVLLSKVGSQAGSVSSLLFGSIVTVTWSDIAAMSSLGLLVIFFIWYWYPSLYAVALDEELAQSSGVSSYVFNMLLVVLSAVTVAISIRVIGVLLVGALMVIPVLAAMQWGQSFLRTLCIAICLAILAVLAGISTSYLFDLSTGGCIVLWAIAGFICSAVLGRRS